MTALVHDEYPTTSLGVYGAGMARSYSPTFELRRLLVKWSRTPTGILVEGPAVASFHFAKLTAGAVDSNWLAADYAAIETRFDTWWTTAKTHYGTLIALSEYRWYKSGPAWEPDDLANGPSNPSVRTTARSVAGTSAGVMMPPQVAISVTEITDIRKRWGRFYLPGTISSESTTSGRFNGTATQLALLVTLYNGIRADGYLPVVFTRGRSAYTTIHGTAVPAHAATAYEITDLQVDDNYDVQRSRRWSAPSVRSRTLLT